MQNDFGGILRIGPSGRGCRLGLAAWVLWLPAACGHASRPPAPTSMASVPAGASAQAEQGAMRPVELPRVATDEPGAALKLTNAFPITQHLFVAGKRLGEVPAGSDATFPIPVGTYEVVCADSVDPNNNPTRIVAKFEAGYEYSYRVIGE